MSTNISNEEILTKLRPTVGYKRIDQEILANEFQSFIENHAIHDTLWGSGKIEVYEIYKNLNEDEVFSIITFGKALNGHPGVVHGGITALLIDNTFGWLFFSLKTPMAMTANLNINYRRPILAGTTVVLKAKLSSKEGRKLFMSASMENENGEVLADSTTLFIMKKTE
eukprot:gene17099-22612_t